MQCSRDDSEVVINGVNVAQLPASTPYAHGLLLLDILFTKEELGGSLMYQPRTGRSKKNGLDKKRVAQLVSLMQKRYKSTEYDMKVLVSKINQKCRDSNVVRVKRECLPTKSCPSKISSGNGVKQQLESNRDVDYHDNQVSEDDDYVSVIYTRVKLIWYLLLQLVTFLVLCILLYAGLYSCLC